LEVYVETRSLPALPAGHYYQHQILGLYVYEEEELLGEISEIIETGANDVLSFTREMARICSFPIFLRLS